MGGVGFIVNAKPILAFIVLGLTAGHALFKTIRLRNTDQFAGLVASSFVISMLLLLPIAQAYSVTLREIARERGVYEMRRPVQRVVTLSAICATPLVGILVGLWLGKKRLPLLGVIVFSLLTLMGVIVKVVSYHPVDELMGIDLAPGVSLFETFFGIGILALNACLLGCVRDK